MSADERADRVRAGIAELRDEDEVEHIEPAAVLDTGEKVDLLDEIQKPRHVHQPEKRGRNRENARGVAARSELPHAQSEHEEDEKARLEIVDARRRFVKPEFACAVQECADHQQRPADQPPALEANQAALLHQSVKFRKAKAGKENHDGKQNVVRDEFVAREQGRQDDGPEYDRADQPAKKDFRLRRRGGRGGGVRRARFGL